MTEHQELSARNLSNSARRIVGLVALLNGAAAVVEATIAAFIGSVSLFADSADFLEDFLINGLVFCALSWSATSRRKASFGLAALILIPAIAAFGTALYKVFSASVPEPTALTATSVAALAVNLLCAMLLLRLRSGDTALTRGAWLAARNDAVANVLMILAGISTFFWYSMWPDVITGVLMGIINCFAAKEVYEQARAEDPELEFD